MTSYKACLLRKGQVHCLLHSGIFKNVILCVYNAHRVQKRALDPWKWR